MSDRGRRIKDREMLKKRVASYCCCKNLSEEQISKLVDNPQCCSCAGCGNPRKTCKGKDRLSIQERKMSDAE